MLKIALSSLNYLVTFLKIYMCELSNLVRWSIFLSLHQYHTVLITIVLQEVLNSGRVSLPTLYFFFKIVLNILDHLQFHIHFRISVSISAKKDCWGFDRDNTESTINLEKTDTLTILRLAIHEHIYISQFRYSQFIIATFCSFQCTGLAYMY